jgi:hypothetical protein
VEAKAAAGEPVQLTDAGPLDFRDFQFLEAGAELELGVSVCS